MCNVRRRCIEHRLQEVHIQTHAVPGNPKPRPALGRKETARQSSMRHASCSTWWTSREIVVHGKIRPFQFTVGRVHGQLSFLLALRPVVRGRLTGVVAT
jgi:hypothetical protein